MKNIIAPCRGLHLEMNKMYNESFVTSQLRQSLSLICYEILVLKLNEIVCLVI